LLPTGRFIKIELIEPCGEVSERLKEPASKAGSLGNRARRFKSYPLRQIFHSRFEC
jgi:hypothetical protein